MKRLAVLALLFVGLLGCHSAPKDTVTQFSTIDAILAGAYEGRMTLAELRRYGDHGIGTFDALDGEMILLDGLFYQVRGDGRVLRPDDSLTTPFASVVALRPDRALPVVAPLNFAAFRLNVDAAIPNANNFCAVKAVGRFSSVKVRSVPPQTKPYPPLVEVTKSQPVFTAADVEGVLVGFRTPEFGKGINVPGYHLHFISGDRSFGGHVLEFVMERGTIELDYCPRLALILPETSDFGKVNLSLDRAAELEKAEK